MKIQKLSSESEQDGIFSSLPPEITLDILSRVPIKAVFTCKCVCKSWLGLLETPEFARSHLSNSVLGLLSHHVIRTEDAETDLFEVFDFEDSLDIERYELHYKTAIEVRSDRIFGGSSSLITQIDGSTNGFLFFRNLFPHPEAYYICNPITHECLKLPKPEGIHREDSTKVVYGFGASRLSNQYKVVKIAHDVKRDPNTDSLLSISKFVWQVYHLGTGSWRNVTPPCEMFLDYNYSTGVLLNSNLHWLARNFEGSLWISCFDLETEVFTKIRAPIVESNLTEVGVLRDRLCLSDYSSMSEVVIYLMTDDGDDKKSWNKEYVINKFPAFSGESLDAVYAVKAFREGDLLLLLHGVCMSYYSTRTKTVGLLNIFDSAATDFREAISYTPSFIRLKDFETENAKVSEFVCFMG